jgi:hypothetical protein
MTGTQSRNPIITAQPQHGGQACPPLEQQPCLVDCEGAWGCWSSCTSLSGNTPPFTRNRNYVVQIYKKNGGSACPTAETDSCVPDVCYSADSPELSSFGAKMMGMRPIQTLPSGHPGLSRTDCGGPLTTTDIIPTYDAALSGVDCSGGPLLYAYDSTSGTTKSTMANGKDGLSQMYFMQDSQAHLHFGMVNGQPTGASSNFAGSFTFKNAQNTGKLLESVGAIEWTVENDVSLTQWDACDALNNKDCYQWDVSKKRAKSEWHWSSNKNSGGMLGPLPAYGFCVEIVVGDVKGIANYEFSSYENKQWPLVAKGFDIDAMDVGLVVCTYACPQPSTCVEPVAGTVGNSDGTTGTTAGGTSGGNGGTSGTSGSGSGSGNGGTGNSGSSTTSSSGSGTTSSSGSGTTSSSGSGTTSSSGSGTGMGGSGGGDANDSSSGIGGCSTGNINAAGDGCEAACSSGHINAAGDGCEAGCLRVRGHLKRPVN